MEGKKRHRPPFFNQIFSQLIDDYKNNKPDLTFNVLEGIFGYFDSDNYQSYTPQHKIRRWLNKESGILMKYYKTVPQEDEYKGYSTNYQNLNIDICK